MVSEENVQLLQSMGFDELDIRRALKLSNNDLNEAVSILTNEHPVSGYDTLHEVDVEMKDNSGQQQDTGPSPLPLSLPAPPPSYDEVVDADHATASGEAGPKPQEQQEDNGLEFPVANLYELENRVFTDSWSIPYKKEESLGKCLLAANRLAQEKLCDSDQYCKRFLDRCMPDAMQKLMTSGPVRRWGPEIQEGIYDMLVLLIEVVTSRLKYEPVPCGLMGVLAMSFDPDTEYHNKNKMKRQDKYWEETLGADQLFAAESITSSRDPYGWLTNMLNMFGEKGGFESIKDRLTSTGLDAPSMAALLDPVGICAEFLNGKVLQPLLLPALESCYNYVNNLSENDLKEKKVGSVCDMLASMKLICLHLWPEEVQKVDTLRLGIVLRMLKAPHYNARMNALKEVTKLIEDSSGNRAPKSAIDREDILDWLVKKKVLSIALEGNIDHSQYCDKIKNIVDFLGPDLSLDELTKIWRMQVGQRNVVIDNIHSIIAAAGVKFNQQQQEQLFMLIQRSWEVEDNKMREKLLNLIGKIGREAKVYKTTNSVLELLWDLAHLPRLPAQLVELALEEHLAILSDSSLVKDHIKLQTSYTDKCVEDIKDGTWVLPALKQLHQIVKNIAKNHFNKVEKTILQDLNKSYDIIKQVTNRLIKFHQMAVQQAKDSGTPLSPDSSTDGRYTHKDYMTAHLSFLQFVLQEGMLYLPWSRARDLWSTLIANSEACTWDRETCYEWFTKGISDLEQDTQSQLFQKEILKLDPGKISLKGFSCFKCFFERVNLGDHKLKKQGLNFVVEKLELTGLDFLWEICLDTQDTEIAEQAVVLLMSMSYTSLSARIKRDPIVLHKKFIDECYTRLELAMIPLSASALAQVVSSASKLLIAVSAPDLAVMPSPSRSANLLSIERLLLVAERYIVTVEELHTSPRSILPHGASFQGHNLSLYIICESPKMEFTIEVHSNETIGSVRHKIGKQLKHSPSQVQIVANDKMLNKDQKLLHQLGIEDQQVLTVRTYGSVSSISSFSSTQDMSSVGTTKLHSFDMEQEKMMPGVVMASGGQVFEMLYQLSGLDEPRITTRARKLLKLIPTDPSVLDALESLGQKSYRQPSPEEIPRSPKASPRSSPRKFVPGPTPAAQSPGGRLSGKDLLKSLFDATADNMSTFRVLYNLEVLSSKLMPTALDSGNQPSTGKFCEDFLNSGGLGLVVNILQRDAMPPDVDYETRQGCYAISLQLLRFLLCGHEMTADSLLPSSQGQRKVSTGSSGSASTGGAAAASLAGAGAGVGSGPPSFEITPAAASRAIQTMGTNDFTETVACFMRVAWAAAAGKLHLASSAQPMKDSTTLSAAVYNNNVRGRQSSTGSTASSGSESESVCLHAGVCVKQSEVSTKDANIAKEALELLVTCLQLRSPLLASFYTLPCVADFVIDILVGSTHAEIREVALTQFFLLSQTEVTPSECTGHQQTPHQFMVQTLLKARLPFWVSSSSTRGASQRLLKQCSQYFDLRCKLLSDLTVLSQKRLQIQVSSMIEDEIGWLANFVPSETEALRETDYVLIAGHLRLIKTLLTCESVNKREAGSSLVQDVLHDFLFPASKFFMEDQTDGSSSIISYMPKCGSSASRVAAYNLLVELADDNLENLQEINSELINMHHQTHPEAINQWEYMPPVDRRSHAGFVGLKNGGATCYMNSVIQQLYMSPGIPDAVLGVDDEQVPEESVLGQIQHVFGHLMDSQLQYYVPERFWKVFKLWGQTVNIREQQDAFDFYTSLVDQLDEQMKKLGRDEIFKRRFQGMFSDQKICKDCPHRYEREEAFFALNVTVKNATLQDSLDQFVKGELLEGDNAYFCEKCGEKRNTIKRMCIKSLPPVLCIQLKRFDYDWEANRALKFDDHFKFPLVLDMEPYTSDGMARREEQEQRVLDSNVPDENDPGLVVNFSSVPTCRQINYELVGVVVHSGQANAGHYYSYIKDRRGDYMSNPSKGRWYKFNDTIVQEFEMNDPALEAECFGGKYKAKVLDQTTSYPEERLRNWNGYLLFYERIEEAKTPMSAKKSKVAMRLSHPERHSIKRSSDSLVELTELVHKGEKKGLFMDKMPARIQQVVRDENLKFMKNRDVYNIDYFRFMRNLISKNMVNRGQDHYSEMCLESLQLAVNFLFNTYFRTKKKLRGDLEEWVRIAENLIKNCKDACLWMVDYLSGVGGSFIKPFLLECPTREIREAFGTILEKTLGSFFQHGGVSTHKCFSELVEQLLCCLTKDLPENIKHCTQYFQLLLDYVGMGTKSVSHMFGRNAFPRLVMFLLGPAVVNHSSHDSHLRRWSSAQSRDFGPLHATLATLVLNTDVAPYRTEDAGDHSVYIATVTPQIYLKMSADMQKFVFGADSHSYIQEVVMALREVSSGLSVIEDMLLYCSFCNGPFSMLVIKNIMHQYTTAPSNELKGTFQVLLRLLLLEDALQLKRLQCVIDGYKDERDECYEGMLSVIKLSHQNDSIRSYQCIKFLVSLSNRCALAKDYLMQSATKWQWAVNWLKKKMSEHYWTPQTDITSNETSSSKSFQRTISAQDTLAEATALLTELDAMGQEVQGHDEMDISGDNGTEREEEGEGEGEREGDREGEGGEDSQTSTQSTQPYDLDEVDAMV